MSNNPRSLAINYFDLYLNNQDTKLMMLAKNGDNEGVLSILQQSTPHINDAKHHRCASHINDVNAFQETALIIAVKYNHINVVETLIKFGADVTITNYRGITALSMAAGSGFLDIVKFLLSTKEGLSTINIPDFNDNTPLHRAANYNHFNICETLLVYQANNKLSNVYGQTADKMTTSEELAQFIRDYYLLDIKEPDDIYQ